MTVLQEDSHAVQYPRRFVLDNSDIDAMLRIIYEERGLTLRAMTFSAARDMIEIRKLEGAAVLSRSHHAVARDAAAEISAGRGPGRHHFLWLSLPAEEMLRAGLQRSAEIHALYLRAGCGHPAQVAAAAGIHHGRRISGH
ncbi:MAG: hypothetical protein ACLTG4_09715 [Oscillospiraceae bacterium]